MLVAVALLFVVALFALVLDRGSQAQTSRPTVRQLVVKAPISVAVGEDFVVEVSDIVRGDAVEVWVDGGYGARRSSAMVKDGTALVEVEAARGPESGTVLIHAIGEDAVGNTTVELVPGPAVDPLDLYLGPRTVLADGRDFSMIVAVPKDSFGNPVAAGTPVDYMVTRESGAQADASEPTEGLLSFHRIFSRTVATRTRVAATVGAASGPERSFLEVAGIPLSFDLSLLDEVPLADGHTLVRVRTSDLSDEFGNMLPDGTIVYLDAQGVTGVRRMRSVTIEGQAEFVVEAPTEPGRATFVATASGIPSTRLELDFPSAVAELPVEAVAVQVDGREAVEVRVGRVVTTRASYVPDGTLARVVAGDDVFEVPLELGEAAVTVPLTSGTAEVTVLGRTTSVDFEVQETGS